MNKPNQTNETASVQPDNERRFIDVRPRDDNGRFKPKQIEGMNKPNETVTGEGNTPREVLKSIIDRCLKRPTKLMWCYSWMNEPKKLWREIYRDQREYARIACHANCDLISIRGFGTLKQSRLTIENRNHSERQTCEYLGCKGH